MYVERLWRSNAAGATYVHPVRHQIGPLAHLATPISAFGPDMTGDGPPRGPCSKEGGTKRKRYQKDANQNE